MRCEVLLIIVLVRRMHPSNASGTPCPHDRAPHYDDGVSLLPPDDETWIALTDDALDLEQATVWAGRPDCGAVVVFSGLVRNHAEGVTDVTHIDYEAYGEQVIPRFAAVVEQARVRWPDVARVVVWHREGRVALSESSVLVVASSPHRDTAFDAARFVIDTLKATVPIWKKEFWNGGSEWARGTQHIVEVSELPSAQEVVGP